MFLISINHIDPRKFQKQNPACPKCGSEMREGYCAKAFCLAPDLRKKKENAR